MLPCESDWTDQRLGTAPESFSTTHWSVVLEATRLFSPGASDALERLCRTYWYPLYSYVRRQGYSPADAQDLTQEFFAHFLEKNYLRAANRERGRFRSFLLISLKHFLAHQWEKARAWKRGGRVSFLSWEAQNSEERYRLEPVSEMSPERLYDQRWAYTLLERALAGLRTEFGQAGKIAQFEELKQFLSTDPGEGAYSNSAAALGTTPGAIAVAVHRLRQRYAELLRQEVAHTLAQETDIEDELRHLVTVLHP